MHPVEVDGSTLYCVGASTDPAAIADRLAGRRVRVEPAAPDTRFAGKMVALAAHDLSAAELAELCRGTSGSWVHLVSSGFGYPHLTRLAGVNLLTRSARAYAEALSEYVVTQHVLRQAGPGGARARMPKPFNRRAALVAGFGAFGRTVAGVLTGLGARVMVIRPRSRTAHPFDVESGRPLRALPEHWADLLIVALPGIAELDGFIGDDLFRVLRPDAHVINPARAAPVDFEALRRWLTAGSGCLTSDVETAERVRGLTPWIESGRVTVTPHIAWRPWDGDPLYHGDWLSIYATTTGAGGAQRTVRVDPREIAADYLIP